MYPGAIINTRGVCNFNVWSPMAGRMELKIFGDNELRLPMNKVNNNFWTLAVENLHPGDKYFYVIDGNKSRPDPASYFQPEGVHGPSQVIDHNSFKWQDDNWSGATEADAIIYELHIGTFTEQGTFLSAVEKLDQLAELGITAIEIMPVSQFPGKRNWGYDGVYPYAPANAYGTPDEFKTLIQECHLRNIAVILDVVYNHFGPEGNYLNDYGPYFTDKYKTPWGLAINYDEAHSDQVRDYFIGNALYWLKQYHIDGLRLDAIHQIYDFSAAHILSEINKEVKALCHSDGKKRMVIAESDLNDIKVINDYSSDGYSCSSQWSDDFHHALHSFITGERDGYYADFGSAADLKKALESTFVFNGIYSPYRIRKHGNDATNISPEKFIIFTQNHDQVGNRAFGERLSNLISTEALKLSGAVLLLSPYIPLIFMGEEYGETSPFQYFVEHGDPDLIKAVQNGRKQEFASFKWKGEIPDPQSEKTFLNSKLKWDFNSDDNKKRIRKFYKTLISLRKNIPALAHKSKTDMEIQCCNEKKVMTIRRWNGESCVFMIFNLLNEENEYIRNGLEGKWKKIFHSENEEVEHDSYLEEDEKKLTLGKYSVVIFEKEE